ncbi:tetratricopeptide repeat protein [Salmonella enterica]|uniref:tetratricopeptide repeat protein n=1 Tax=Salmonella enterica TaxID=28901 RepID=UPI00083F513B|nr:tetratricopeptide repeat protein [Salmonella enterica]ECN4919565.1 sel1 repeat family protein [Salmonella enterica subsp. enterica serovar Kentucky]ODK04099.1 hypothetical protein BFG10_06150 [Salmonella enterica subsp. enterica serovar Kentucky]ODK24654.1 hypothetical protein BFG15_13515 [Salmonella enterica subsp. enterica serovar Kentucky]HDO8400729.1 sel1 repeat family protein [Salmonella enterica subsp. enterica serovar Concord]
MKLLLALMLFMTFFAHAADPEPGSQYLQAAEAGDKRAQYFLADSWLSYGDLNKAEYWAQIKITNPVSLDYPDAKKLAEKAANAGSKAGEITLARILVNTQAGRPDYPKAISLLQKASEDLDNDSAVDAQMLLGLIYANGVGIAADDEKAAWYFKRSSAISRTGYSEYWAGMMFLNGEPGFIEKNKQKALHWLNLSCLEGFDTGCEEFETLTNG